MSKQQAYCLEEYWNNKDSLSESMEDFWNRAHFDAHPFWLSNTPGSQIWSTLEVPEDMLHGATILNIGVGTGLCSRELARVANKLHVLDISPIALKRVADIATLWLPSQLDSLPAETFDLAISHLVAQHMSDDDLIVQFKAVLKSLKPDGFFAVQFASPLDECSSDSRDVVEQKCGMVRRSQDRIQHLIRESGGKIKKIWDGPEYPEFMMAWTMVHVCRLEA